MREDNGDNVPRGLEGFHEGVNVWGGLVGGRTVVIDNLVDCKLPVASLWVLLLWCLPKYA